MKLVTTKAAAKHDLLFNKSVIHSNFIVTAKRDENASMLV